MVRLMFAAAIFLGLSLTRSSAAERGIDVDGAVSVSTMSGASVVADASKVVIWLVPLQGSIAETNGREKKYQMLQRDKKFTPSLLVVPIGSLVAFPNLDPWFHNVFSLYRGKRFDLGLYQAGDTKTVRFDRPGASYIFCNIHPEMSAVVLTVDSPYFAVSDKTGHVAIPSVPAGRYRLHVWYENADSAALDGLSRDIAVNDEDRTLPAMAIQITRHEIKGHKNKYGHEYDSGMLGPSY